MTVTASPLDLGLCEPAALASALWDHVTALLVQVGEPRDRLFQLVG